MKLSRSVIAKFSIKKDKAICRNALATLQNLADGLLAPLIEQTPSDTICMVLDGSDIAVLQDIEQKAEYLLDKFHSAANVDPVEPQ